MGLAEQLEHHWPALPKGKILVADDGRQVSFYADVRALQVLVAVLLGPAGPVPYIYVRDPSKRVLAEPAL